MDLKLINWLGLHPKVLTYVAVIAITVLVTVPVTISILGAREVVATLDEVVESQARLEDSLNKVFHNVGERIESIDKQLADLRDVTIKSNQVYGNMFLEICEGKSNYLILVERLNFLDEYQTEKLGE